VDVNDDSKCVAICTPTSAIPFVPESVVHPCYKCGTNCWVSPASLARKRDDQTFHALCLHCFVAEPPEGAVVEGPNEEQWREVRRVLGLDKTQ